MARFSNRTLALALSFSVAAVANSAFAAPDAFPGALGFGANASGGRTGSIYVVSNLNDSGAGSFRDAVSHSNRIIVFAVSGQINLLSPVTAQSNLSILGQTAPGGGIVVQGAETSFFGRTNEIVQYVHFRDGTTDPDYNGNSTTSGSSANALNLGNVSSMMLDHVSAEFAAYNNIDATGTNNVSITNSIIANPIATQRFNLHIEGANTTIMNNVFADAQGRSGLVKSNAQYVNNIVTNYGYALTTGNSSGNFSFDVVNNYFVAGPNTSTASDDFYQIDTNQSAYAAGNILDSNKDGVLNGGSDNTTGAVVLNSPWSASTLTLPTLSAAGAWAHDTTYAGPNIKHDPNTYATTTGWDQVDAQVMSTVLTIGSSGRRWTSQSNTGLSNGGWGDENPGVSSVYLPTSTPNDGIPDSWAKSHGLAATSVSEATKLNALGYAMVEQYAYEITDVYANQTWSNSSGSWVSGAWSAAAPGLYDHALIRGTGAGNGAATISGSDSANAFSLSIGGNGPTSGESLTISGGSLNVQDTITVGDQNNGSLAISGGTVRATNIQLGNTIWAPDGSSSSTYNGTLSLTGGSLVVQQIVLGGGSPGNWTTGGSFNWSGNATIQLTGNFAINPPTTLGAGGGILDTNGFSGTFSGNISGNGGLTKIGAGTVTLSGTNAYSGGTTISGGEISISSDNNIGGPNTPVTFNGGLLQITGLVNTAFDTHPVNWSSFNGGFDLSNKSSIITISQNIGGSGSFSVGGAGTVVLTGTNTYTGGTTLLGGELSIASDASIGGTTSKITFNGGLLQINGAQPNIDSHNVNWSTFSGGFDIVSAANTFTVGSAIGGSGIFTKAGAGVLLLNNANTFTGATTISGGTLRIGNALALQNSTVNITGSGASLDLNHLNATLGGLSGNQPLDLQNTTLTVGNNDANTTFTGNITSTGAPGALIKNGAGELTLGGNSTFGNTTISAGDIRATSNNAFGTGTITSNILNGIELATGVTIPNNIVASPGTNEFADVPDASATATLAGNVSITGTSNQYRLGISGSSATLILTGTHTTNTLTLITHGNILFAANGSLTSTQAISIGRNSSGSAEHLTLQDNAFLSSTAGINIGGINGSSDDGNTTVALNGNASLNAGTKPLNLNNSAVAGTTTLTLNGNSTAFAGSLTTSGSSQGQSTLTFNGGTLVATASDGAAIFFPTLGTASKPLAATIQSGGATINDGGFNITVAQPLSGTGGFTKTGVGTLTLSGAQTFTGPVTVNGGTLALAPTSTLAATSFAVAQGAILKIQSANNLPNTSGITANGTVALGASDTFAALTLGGATNNWTGALNLAGNKLVIKPSANKAAVLATVQNQIAYGVTHSTGITSSTLPAGFGIAVIDNATLATPFTTFAGQSVDSNSLLIAPELLGDTNADGSVNLADLTAVLNNFGNTTAAWTSGNFDNAPTIDLTDLAYVLNNFGLTNPNASAAPTAAPESATLALLIPAVWSSAFRRRRTPMRSEA